MNQGNRKSKELRFVCPECGSHSLCAYSQGSLDIDHVYEDGVIAWDEMRPDEILDYHCGECGHEIEFREDETIAEWIIAHCDQESDDSGKPRPNSSPTATQDDRT